MKTHGTESNFPKLAYPGEIDPEWSTMRHDLVKLIVFKEKNHLGILVKKRPNQVQRKEKWIITRLRQHVRMQ